MIGQMQGKYQLSVFRNDQALADTLTSMTRTEIDESTQIGHFIHEDSPLRMAGSLLEFIERNDTSAFKTSSNSQLELLNKLNQKWAKKKSS
ncbi:unnamed protein product [Ambrosiozyma monospora]|uniref:Unnamed protein product n=1 Tax=Ambrosiozyma monospora TaxID=43982 RepID=A0A9W6WMT8_AMBMO|nr:unnamed protein product [Ambrosiozyma monospora]GMG40518.1 unnamed protein product [Ambrosiozyma monospora]